MTGDFYPANVNTGNILPTKSITPYLVWKILCRAWWLELVPGGG